MKILQISHRHRVAGGSDAVFFQTSRALERAGHSVVPFCMDDPMNDPSPFAGYFPREANTQSPGLRDVPRYFHNREAAAQLDRLISDHGPFDVAHLHIYHGKQTTSILPVLRRQGIAIVQTLHEYKLACPVYTLERNGEACRACVNGSSFNCVASRCKDGSLARSVAMWAEYNFSRMWGDVRLVDRLICVSDFQKDLMTSAGLPPHKLHCQHNFVAEPDERKPGHEGYLLYFGRLEKVKGIMSLLDAVGRTGDRLVIAGDGKLRAEIEGRARCLPNVDFVGFHTGKRLAALVAGARAVVVPSEWYENCPMSVLEAKAAGRPVLGSAIGGIPELVREGIDGFMFRPGDVGSLSRSLVSLRDADWEALSAAAVSDYRARFSEQVQIDRLLNHYADVIRISQDRQAGLRPVRARAVWTGRKGRQKSVARPSQNPDVALVK